MVERLRSKRGRIANCIWLQGLAKVWQEVTTILSNLHIEQMKRGAAVRACSLSEAGAALARTESEARDAHARAQEVQAAADATAAWIHAAASMQVREGHFTSHQCHHHTTSGVHGDPCGTQ